MLDDGRPLALAPRIETEEAPPGTGGGGAASVVIPLPVDRVRLRRVDVWLSLTRHDDGEITERQHAVFSRNTSGDALRFHLPTLAGGLYDADVRAVALVDTVGADGTLSVDEHESRAVVPVVAASPSEDVLELRFHFEYARPALIASERDAPLAAIEEIASRIAGSRLVQARIDCWASGEGDARFNRDLSQQRCAWFERTVWDRVPGTSGSPLEAVPHGGEGLLVEEPTGAAWREVEAARRQNRVVVLRLHTSG